MTLSEKQAEARAAQELAARANEEAALRYATLFATEDGQWVLEDLKKKVGFNQRVFIRTGQGTVNALHAAIKDGERAVICDILQMIESAKPKEPKKKQKRTP